MNDLRTAARILWRKPSFSLVAVLALALGIGAVTATFSVVDAVLLRPLPYASPGEVVLVHNEWNDTPEADLSPAEYFDYVDQVDVFEAFGVWAGGALNVTGGDRPERLSAGFVSQGVFAALGVEAWRGRLFRPEEDLPDAAPVAVLDHGFWTRYYGADDGVVGGTIRLSGQTYTVVGVLPPGFRLPDEFAAAVPRAVYAPLGFDRTTIPNRGSHFLDGVARLRDGVGFERADAALGAVAARFPETFPDDYPRDMRFGAYLEPVQEAVAGGVRPLLLVLLGAVALVLLIACANVAGLVLTRAEERRVELAVRTALGAGRGRLVRLLVAESLVLAGAGGVLGVVLAAWGTRALVALQPGDIPRVDAVSVDARVLLFAAGVSVLSAVLFGLAPLAGRRAGPAARVRAGGRGGSGARGANRFRRGLLTAEFALALLLLAGAGLLVRSLAELIAVDPGYRTEDVLTVRMTLPSAEYPEDADRRAFYAGLVERVAGLPGVTAVGAASHLPLDNPLGDINVRIEGRPLAPGERSPVLDWQVVTPGYIEALGLTLLRGRTFSAADDVDAPGVAIISRSGAALLFGGEEAIGRRFTLGGGAGPGTVEVVGVVDDVRHEALSAEPRPELYLPHAQFHFWNDGPAVAAMTLAVNTVADPATLAPAIRAAVAEADPSLPLADFRPMRQVAADATARPRFAVFVLGTFAAIALLLAAIGIYGTTAYDISRRTRELGVRVALGASPRQVVGGLLAQGLRVVALGAAIGLAAALLLGRTLSGLLYQVAPHDPATLGAGVLLLGAVALLGVWLPARRVARLDPVRALRAE